MVGSAMIDDFSQPEGSKPSPHIIPRFYLRRGGFIYCDKNLWLCPKRRVPQTLRTQPLAMQIWRLISWRAFSTFTAFLKDVYWSLRKRLVILYKKMA